MVNNLKDKDDAHPRQPCNYCPYALRTEATNNLILVAAVRCIVRRERGFISGSAQRVHRSVAKHFGLIIGSWSCSDNQLVGISRVPF